MDVAATFMDGILIVADDGTPPPWKVEPESAQHTGVAELRPNAQGWVTLTPGHTSGTGGGKVLSYAVISNTTGVARSGTI